VFSHYLVGLDVVLEIAKVPGNWKSWTQVEEGSTQFRWRKFFIFALCPLIVDCPATDDSGMVELTKRVFAAFPNVESILRSKDASNSLLQERLRRVDATRMVNFAKILVKSYIDRHEDLTPGEINYHLKTKDLMPLTFESAFWDTFPFSSDNNIKGQVAWHLYGRRVCVVMNNDVRMFLVEHNLLQASANDEECHAIAQEMLLEKD